MTRLLAICLSLSLGFGVVSACTPSSPNFFSNASTRGSARAIEGKMVLPYRVQDAKVSRLPDVAGYFFGLAAEATDVYVVPITRTDLNYLQASINGVPVDIEIRTVRYDGDDTIVEYYIADTPLIDSSQAYSLEIVTRDGQPLLGGVVSFGSGSVVVYDLTPRTTAVLLKIKEKKGRITITSLPVAELRIYERDPAIVVEESTILTLLRRYGTLRQHVIYLAELDDEDHDRGHGNDPDGFDDDNPGKGGKGRK